MGSPLFDLMIILTLTIVASSITPQVAPNQRVFSGMPKNYDPSLFAANMATQMLWFLRPGAFLQASGGGSSTYSVTEMVPKMGK